MIAYIDHLMINDSFYLSQLLYRSVQTISNIIHPERIIIDDPFLSLFFIFFFKTTLSKNYAFNRCIACWCIIGGLFFHVVVNDFVSLIIYINVIFLNW